MKTGRHGAALVVAAVFVLPLVFMFSGSLRRAGLPPPTSAELIPPGATFANYGRAFDLVPIPRFILNSLLVAVLAVPLTVLVASLAGYAMSQASRRTARILIAASLIALMIPPTSLLVGRFAVFRALHVIDTYWPLIAPSLIGTTPFYVLLFYWSFRRLPPELLDTCRLEGMSPLQTWRRVALPMVRPVAIAVAVLSFGDTWNNFLDPLIFISDRAKFTVPLGLRSLASLDRSNYPYFLAGAVTATLPVAAAFLFLQRFLGQISARGRAPAPVRQ